LAGAFVVLVPVVLVPPWELLGDLPPPQAASASATDAAASTAKSLRFMRRNPSLAGDPRPSR
jgi:hypothetical protein